MKPDTSHGENKMSLKSFETSIRSAASEFRASRALAARTDNSRPACNLPKRNLGPVNKDVLAIFRAAKYKGRG